MSMETGGIILGGGKSARFGKNKCLLDFNGHSLIQIVAETLSVVCREVIVVAKEQDPYAFTGLQIVTDREGRQQPLLGLLAGLEESAYEANIVLACDMPFVHTDSLSVLKNYSKGADAVVPLINEKPQPLHAFYSKNMIPFIRKIVDKGDVRISEVYKEANVVFLNKELFAAHDPELLSFYNINTEEDYKKALEIESTR